MEILRNPQAFDKWKKRLLYIETAEIKEAFHTLGTYFRLKCL
jgi:hypothetical protein